MNRKEFRAVVRDVINSLPEEFLKKLENIDFVVEDQPDEELISDFGFSAKSMILGLYHGVPFGKRGHHYGEIQPDKITIYQKNIEPECKSDKEVREKVHEVIIHEIAHYFGFDERKIRRLGY